MDNFTDKGYQFEFFCDRCGNLSPVRRFERSGTRCSHRVCKSTCWNEKRMPCYDCAPYVEAELGSAQVTITIQQMKDNLRQQGSGLACLIYIDATNYPLSPATNPGEDRKVPVTRAARLQS